jgi:hypothetical protein
MKFETNIKYKIVIAGYIVGGPLGGLVWHHLQYVVGLHAMGHQVLFVEDSDDYPSCYNPQTNQLSTDPSYGLTFINSVFSQYGLQHHWAYYSQHHNQWYGVNEKEVNDFIKKADIFLNLSGVNPLHQILLRIPIRVFIDTDPVFTQIRHLEEPAAFDRARQHTHFFTYGENFGKANCNIPDDGLAWQPTRQPVFLNAWNYSAGNKAAKWTTIMQWDSYKVREYNGQVFGMKSASFNVYFTLPQTINEAFELAIGSATAPREKLAEGGWDITDPISVTISPDTYQRYIQQSKGEWSIAKQGYVISNSGWFSERSTGYLATGRPVVVQDTGFSEVIKTGRGLFSFTSQSEAVAAIEEVNDNYETHCKWAREVAEEYFRFDKVLSTLLQNCQTAVPIH